MMIKDSENSQSGVERGANEAGEPGTLGAKAQWI